MRKLVSPTISTTGVVIATHQPADTIAYGSFEFQ